MSVFILADPQAVTREGIRSLISRWFPGDTVREADGLPALSEALARQGDAIVLLDYPLSEFRSTDHFMIHSLRHPSARWIIFTNELTDQAMRRLGSERNVSILLKDSPADDLERCLEGARAGHQCHCRQIAEALERDKARRTGAEHLTPAEVEVLRLIAQGLSVKEIAANRCSSTHTIVTHKKNIFRKTGVNNVHEATRWALRAGIVEMMEYYI